MPDRSAPVFRRWADLSLPRAFGAAPAPARIDEHWRAANRTIAARLALACVREAMVAGEVVGSSLVIRTGSNSLTLPLARIGAFGLHCPDLQAPRDPALERPDALLRALAPALGAEPRIIDAITRELRDSAFNLALAMLTASLRAYAARTGRLWPAPVDPENLIVEGHPWHPMCKTRLGLSLAEVLRHAPEQLARGQIHAVDVDRDLVQLAGDAEATLARLFTPAAPGQVRLPVHPAQARRLPALFPDLWGSRIRRAAIAPVDARALLSLRTVAVDSAELRVKLSLDVITTSARRTVSPMSVSNGPPITRILRSIAADDPGMSGLVLLGDRAAAGLREDALGPRAPQLGVILRASPQAQLREATGSTSADVWVCAALGERRPGASRSLLAELAERHGSAEAMIRRYIDRLVPPSLHLLSVYGIALELHLQNTLAIVEPSGLAGFVIRDLGGVRIHPERLRAAGHSLTLAPGSFLMSDDIRTVRDKLSHTLLHAHLAAVIRWAERDLGLSARLSWAIVRATIERCAGQISRAHPKSPAALADRDALLQPRSRAKSLLRMRFEGRISDYAYTEVDNILAAPDIVDAARRDLAS